MRAIGQNTPAETIVNLGRKYQGERPFRHPKADLVRKVLLKAAISFQSRRPYRGEALQFTQYRFIQDRTESLRSALRKTNLTPAQHRFWRSAAYTVLTAKTTEPNPRRQRCIEFLCQRSIESIGKRCIEPYRERIPPMGVVKRGLWAQRLFHFFNATESRYLRGCAKCSSASMLRYALRHPEPLLKCLHSRSVGVQLLDSSTSYPQLVLASVHDALIRICQGVKRSATNLPGEFVYPRDAPGAHHFKADGKFVLLI
jgi:hypothetical protein